MRLVLTVLMVLMAVPVYAQEIIVTRGPVAASMRFAWETPPNVVSVSDAQSFEWRIKDGAVPATALTSVTCTLSNSKITCVSPLGQSQADALNRVGSHTLTITSFRQDVGEGPASAPFTLTSPAGAATGLRIIQ